MFLKRLDGEVKPSILFVERWQGRAQPASLAGGDSKKRRDSSQVELHREADFSTITGFPQLAPKIKQQMAHPLLGRAAIPAQGAAP